MTDFNTFTEELFSIDQTIRGPTAYAIDQEWYAKYQNFIESLFSGNSNGVQDLPPIANNPITIYYTRNSTHDDEVNLRRTIAERFDLSNFKVQVIDTNYQALNTSKMALYDYVLVNEQFWNFLVKHFKGGPCLPIHSIPSHQTRLNSQYITATSIETIHSSIAFPAMFIEVKVLIQTAPLRFVSFRMFASQAQKLYQFKELAWIYFKKLWPELSELEDDEMEIFHVQNEEKGEWISNCSQKFLSDLYVREDDKFFFIEGSMKKKGLIYKKRFKILLNAGAEEPQIENEVEKVSGNAIMRIYKKCFRDSCQ